MAKEEWKRLLCVREREVLERVDKRHTCHCEGDTRYLPR